MESFLSKFTLGFLMAQLFPGAALVIYAKLASRPPLYALIR